MESDKLKIVIEANIPFIKGLLDEMADVEYLAPEQIDSAAMRNADALITRTRTRCDRSLLEGSRCQAIATATIGTDHIDLDYCHDEGIAVYNAPGCNAPAVAQYVMASIISILGSDLSGKMIGVVGVGHVGSIVARWAEQLGMDVMLCDPPRAEAEGAEGFVGLKDIYEQADIITFHTPYTTTGRHATHHLLSTDNLELLKRRPLIINSARGPITDTDALLAGLASGAISAVAIDCWEREPQIDRRLLAHAAIATPHIAGYSRQGKIRATQMAVESVCRHFGLPIPQFAHTVAPGACSQVDARKIRASYDPAADTARLKTNPEDFELLRNKYFLRDEVE